MKGKLIKLSDTHYIIVDDSEIKEGDWMFNYSGVKYNEQVVSQCTKNAAINWQQNMHINNETKSIRDCIKKITHSTQPLETKNEEYAWYGGENKITAKTFNKIKPLSLSEVEEAIYGYNLDDLVFNEFKKQDKYTFNEFKDIFILGFKAYQELVKNKLFTVDYMKKAFRAGGAYTLGSHEHFQQTHPDEKEFIKSLLPKTEWDVEFDEQGKLRLL